MGESMIGSTLVVGGDGRYGVVEATDKIIKMAAANKVILFFNFANFLLLCTQNKFYLKFCKKFFS